MVEPCSLCEKCGLCTAVVPRWYPARSAMYRAVVALGRAIGLTPKVPLVTINAREQRRIPPPLDELPAGRVAPRVRGRAPRLVWRPPPGWRIERSPRPCERERGRVPRGGPGASDDRPAAVVAGLRAQLDAARPESAADELGGTPSNIPYPRPCSSRPPAGSALVGSRLRL
jgi:hypothetical protein